MSQDSQGYVDWNLIYILSYAGGIGPIVRRNADGRDLKSAEDRGFNVRRPSGIQNATGYAWGACNPEPLYFRATHPVTHRLTLAAQALQCARLERLGWIPCRADLDLVYGYGTSVGADCRRAR